MSALKVLLFALFIVVALETQASEAESNHLATVKHFMMAFNAQDSLAMAKHVADDVEWLSVDGTQVIVEAKGKHDLIKSMNAYFKSCPTCRSKLSSVISTQNRVSAVEIASWQGASGLNSQRALSVYEFSDKKITRVYYFPAEK